jgi:hypothetical protein
MSPFFRARATGTLCMSRSGGSTTRIRFSSAWRERCSLDFLLEWVRLRNLWGMMPHNGSSYLKGAAFCPGTNSRRRAEPASLVFCWSGQQHSSCHTWPTGLPIRCGSRYSHARVDDASEPSVMESMGKPPAACGIVARGLA